MKNLKEITGLVAIKCKNKESNDELKALHYQANELLYDYSFTFINSNMKNYLKDEFTRLGSEIKALEVTPKVKAKQEEILESLREIVKSLMHYVPDEDEGQCMKVLKATVGRYLKDKAEATKDEATILHTLKKNKVIAVCYNAKLYSAFIKMQEELIDTLIAGYKI